MVPGCFIPESFCHNPVSKFVQSIQKFPAFAFLRHYLARHLRILGYI